MATIGYSNLSAFQNNISLFPTIILTIFFHLLILLLTTLISKTPTPGSKTCPKCSKFLKNLLRGLLSAFTYNTYLRLALESLLPLTLTSFFEFSYLNSSSSSSKSLFLSLLIILLFCAFTVYLLRHRRKESNQELTVGLKEGFGRIFMTLWVVRRIGFGLVLAVFEGWSWMGAVGGCLCGQVGYYGYLVLVRPYVRKRVGVIEIVNESFFLSYLCLLFVMKRENWNDTNIWAVIGMLVGNNFIIFLLLFFAFLRDSICGCGGNKKKAKPEIKPQENADNLRRFDHFRRNNNSSNVENTSQMRLQNPNPSNLRNLRKIIQRHKLKKIEQKHPQNHTSQNPQNP